MGRGRFVVFEGVEGSGKTTQARLLAEWLARRGVPHVQVREPGGTEVGERVRCVLLEGGAVPARAEALLFVAARAAQVEEVVRPALQAGRVVVGDRYELATLAYQGYGRGLPLEALRQLNAFATGGLRADVTFVLDVPVAVAEARRAGAGRAPDRIEREGRAFHERVAEAYRLLAATEPAVELVDGTAGVEAVHREVLRRLGERFPETFGSRPG